nr:TPA_asm: hypothetical protein HUJ06_026638 [Nelumbo nucifera]
MHPVKSTTDVLDLMQIGLTNRAVSSTAMNQRSSRSHSVLTVHVRGMDLASGDALRGSLHLVDLAGSERVDRSEVTGERLKEAQHINKSLSALGDVIFALAQKSPHVPYRNSKLTQVLQSSLGGQAKTLMFVQLNPDLNSYSETLSTLKFAERVSGVELGAARSSKEGKDVRELIEQVASLKDTIAKKDEEIEQLQLLKDLRTMSPSVSCEKQDTSLLWCGSSLPSKHSLSATPSQSQRQSAEKGSKHDKATSDQDKCSENNDKHSEASSQQSLDDFRHHKELFCQSKLAAGDSGQNFSADVELLGFGNPDSERSSDISDSGLSMGTETDGSICSVVEFSPFSEGSKPPESPEGSKPPESPEGSKPAESTEKDKAPSKMLRPSLQKQRQAKMVRPSSSKDLSKLSAIIQKQGQEKMVRPSSSKDLSKLSPTSRKTTSSSSLTKPPKRGQ